MHSGYQSSEQNSSRSNLLSNSQGSNSNGNNAAASHLPSRHYNYSGGGGGGGGSMPGIIRKLQAGNGLFGPDRELSYAVLVWTVIQMAATASVLSASQTIQNNPVYWWWPLIDLVRIMLIAMVRLMWVLKYVQGSFLFYL